MDIAELQADLGRAQASLVDHATKESQGAISHATLVAASVALDRVSSDLGRGSIGEPASDLRSLRSDQTLLRALNEDIQLEHDRLTEEVVGWIADGWELEANGQAEILSTEHMKIVPKLDNAEQDNLKDFPVQGYSPIEIVENLVYSLRRDFMGALGRGINQATSGGGIIAPLAQVSADHAGRVGRAAGECFLAGAQAARLSIGAALRRVFQ